jgi:hypothetical protein
VGKRQRHSDFIGMPIEEIEKVAKNKNLPTAERLKAVAELKFLKLRNRQKRSK